MNVTIVGNHNINLTGRIVSKMASYMVVLSKEEMWGKHGVSIRAPRTGLAASSPVETSAVHLAEALDLAVYWVRPIGSGRSDVFTRDYSLVESSDRVLAFFRHDRVMEGGTGHVVHAALTRGIPVEAWVSYPDGSLDSVGSDDGFEVNEEGSRWMMGQFMEWELRLAEKAIDESMFRWEDAPAISTTTAPRTFIGTVGGGSIDTTTSGLSGTILFPSGTKVWLGGDKWTTTNTGNSTTPRS